jgi:hypothetical protein
MYPVAADSLWHIAQTGGHLRQDEFLSAPSLARQESLLIS